MIKDLPVEVISIKSPLTIYDCEWNLSLPVRLFTKILALILGYKKCGWFLMIEMNKNI